MSKANPLLVAGIVVTSLTAAYLWRQLHEERTRWAQLQPATVPPVHEPQEVPKLGTPSLVQPAGAAAPQIAANAGPAPLPTDAVARDIELRRQNPNYIGAVEGKSAQMQLRYPDLARELGMTAAEAESLYDLLMKQQRELNALALPGAAGEDEALKRETQRVLEDLQRKQKAELDAKLLGREQQWKDYQVTLDARRRVSELTNMVKTTSPLSDYQARLLVSNVVGEQQRRASEQNLRGPPANTPLARLEFDEANQLAREESNRRTIEASRSFLDEQQITTMRNAMDGLNRQNRAQLAARRAQIAASRPTQ